MPYFSNRLAAFVVTTLLAVFALACSPEVGSDKWCEKMKEKDRTTKDLLIRLLQETEVCQAK